MYNSFLTNDSDIGAEVEATLLVANKCYFGLQRLLSSRFPWGKIKLMFYKTLISLVLYGCETWTISKTKLKIFEGRILRKIYGLLKEEGV
jgi:hypothetical protein